MRRGIVTVCLNHVLYERDPSGEFLHFYTATVGGRLCFRS